jgi:phytanoyl-CoA hydroxylase
MTVDTELRRHPWNTSFEWQEHSGPFQQVTDEQARQFDEQGFFVLEGAFSEDELAPVREVIDRKEARLEDLLRQQEGERVSIAEAGAITFTTNIALRNDTLRAFATDPLFGRLCADLVGPDANLYWDQAVYKKPEKPRRFPWHQDNGYTFVEPQQYLTCWVALTDATEANGCPLVVPGLHKLGTLEHWWTDYGFQCVEDPSDYVAAEARAGSVVVFSSLTPHQTGPNTTDDVRKAYIVQYAPAGAEMFREENGEITRELADDPERQFLVVEGGEVQR